MLTLKLNIIFFTNMDADVQINELRPRCAESHKEAPHFLCATVAIGSDVDADSFDHGEVSLRKREHWLAEDIVVEKQKIFSVEDRKRFFVESSTGSEDTGGDRIFVAAKSAFRIAETVEETVGFENDVWMNQKLLIDFHTYFRRQWECRLAVSVLVSDCLRGGHRCRGGWSGRVIEDQKYWAALAVLELRIHISPKINTHEVFAGLQDEPVQRERHLESIRSNGNVIVLARYKVYPLWLG